MPFFVLSSLVLLAGALFSFSCREARLRRLSACGGVILGSLLGLVPAVQVLITKTPLEIFLGNPIPGLSIRLGIDPLGAFFLAALFLLSLLAGVYGLGYFRDHPRLCASLPFFPLLVAAMGWVAAAENGFLFLLAWEGMSLASYFLVITEHQTPKVRHAGWVYLTATHLATAFLAAFFVILYVKNGSFDFQAFTGQGPSGLLFLLMLAGFGTKAGIFPLHVWLPHAHPAAPSPVSALMSGVMIKMGIYGILRSLTFLGPPPLWWGEVLVVLGILSAVLGVLYALMQHDLKSLLAYHSVENIGIIVIGIGLGLIGMTLDKPILQILGFAGALFHVWNHALFKGLLFLGAGSVARATHTLLIDRMGGLFKKMPVTGTTFLIASAAICGLPPLNGFVSEWLIYLGLFHAAQSLSQFPFFVAAAGIIGIAFAGGLALACFTKVFGIIFLGEPRQPLTEPSPEAPLSMLWPMGLLSALCIFLGLFPALVFPLLISVASKWAPLLPFYARHYPVFSSLMTLQIVLALFLGFLLLFFLAGGFFFGRKKARPAVTWDCGFAAPSPRMQYTAASFAQPVGAFFRLGEHPEDLSEKVLLAPLFEKVSRFFAWIRKGQRSQVQDHLKWIFATLIILLLWEVWIGI